MVKDFSTKLYNVSLIIVQFGELELLKEFLVSIANHTDRNLISEIIVVDNGKNLDNVTDNYLNGLEYPIPIKIVVNFKNSYASGLNKGVAESSGDILILANNDIILLPDYSIKILLDHFINEKVGIVGPQLVFSDKSWQSSYGSYPSLISAVKSVLMVDSIGNVISKRKFNQGSLKVSHVNFIDGAFMCVRRKCFESCNGFDESFNFYTEETDLCYRAKKLGWDILFEPRTRIVHLRGATSSQKRPMDFQRKLLNSQMYFIHKHFSPFKALLYGWLIKIALLERAILYGIIAFFYSSSKWRVRSENAIMRWKSVN